MQSSGTTLSAGPTPTGSGESQQSGYMGSAGSGRGGAEEEDNGSGMAWVRRRKKEREEAAHHRAA